MNDYEYKQLRQRAIDRDMTEVCGRLGIELGTRGRWRECRCPNPQHEDRDPSFKVNVNANRFKCFSCWVRGNNIDLVQMVRGCSYSEAISFILGNSVSYVPYSKPLPEKSQKNEVDIQWLWGLVSAREYYRCLSPWAQEFLKERRISPNLIDRLGIVSIDRPVATQRQKFTSSKGKLYTPKFPAPSLLFPYRDENGIVINVQARLHTRKEGQQRFHFPFGSHTSLFNPRDALTLPDGADLWLCEGVTDALALMTSGRPTLAIASATSLTREASDFIAAQANRHHLHIFPDNDSPGEALYQKLLALCPNIRRHTLPDGIKDFGQAWAQCIELS